MESGLGSAAICTVLVGGSGGWDFIIILLWNDLHPFRAASLTLPHGGFGTTASVSGKKKSFCRALMMQKHVIRNDSPLMVRQCSV